jgi:hypothetical protein
MAQIIPIAPVPIIPVIPVAPVPIVPVAPVPVAPSPVTPPPPPSHGGAFALGLMMFGGDSKVSYNDPSLTPLQREMVALHSMEMSFELVQQSAGGFSDAETLLSE